MMNWSRGELLAMRDDPEELAADLDAFLGNPGAYEGTVERGSAFARGETWAKVAAMYRELYAG